MEKPNEKWEEVVDEGRLKAEVIVEFIIKDSQIVDVKAKLARQKYWLN